MTAVQPGSHAEHAAEMVKGCGGNDWVQQAQVHATLAVSDAIRDLIGQVADLTAGLAEARDALADALFDALEALATETRDLAAEVGNLAELADCTPARPARRPWRRRARAGSES